MAQRDNVRSNERKIIPPPLPDRQVVPVHNGGPDNAKIIPLPVKLTTLPVQIKPPVPFIVVKKEPPIMLPLPKAVPVSPSLRVLKIPVNRIRRNAEQPRKRFSEGELKQLGKSLVQDGQNDPIEVLEVFDDPSADYELIKGERRWRSAQAIGMLTLDAIVRTREEVPDKKTQHRRCFIADFHHAEYSKLEIALALKTEYDQGATMEELCAICGKSIAWVSSHLALTTLCPELLKLLDPTLPRSQQLSFSIAWRIARLPLNRQMEVHEGVLKVKGTRLQLLKVKELVLAINPGKPRGRLRKPSDYCRNLQVVIPRALADSLTAEGYADDVFTSLLENHGPEEINLMLRHLAGTIQKFSALEQRIRKAQSLLVPKK